jgi:ABC-type multidrug transport system permease subunit
LGFVIILISILVPTSSKYHDGYGEVAQTSTYVPIAMLGILLSIVMLLYGIFFPIRTIKYTCSNCKYEKEYKK